jgi:hypothetical protein
MDEFPGAQYLFFGFGDRHYLLAKNRGAPVALAALWPGRGMFLATGLTSAPSVAFGDSLRSRSRGHGAPCERCAVLCLAFLGQVGGERKLTPYPIHDG